MKRKLPSLFVSSYLFDGRASSLLICLLPMYIFVFRSLSFLFLVVVSQNTEYRQCNGMDGTRQLTITTTKTRRPSYINNEQNWIHVIGLQILASIFHHAQLLIYTFHNYILQ